MDRCSLFSWKFKSFFFIIKRYFLGNGATRANSEVYRGDRGRGSPCYTHLCTAEVQHRGGVRVHREKDPRPAEGLHLRASSHHHQVRCSPSLDLVDYQQKIHIRRNYYSSRKISKCRFLFLFANWSSKIHRSRIELTAAKNLSFAEWCSNFEESVFYRSQLPL